jgi:hypothetical protein
VTDWKAKYDEQVIVTEGVQAKLDYAKGQLTNILALAEQIKNEAIGD